MNMKGWPFEPLGDLNPDGPPDGEPPGSPL